MINYTVVYARSTFDLTTKVEIMLKLGWMTTGGVSVGGGLYGGYYQAMLKITPEDLAEDPCGS